MAMLGSCQALSKCSVQFSHCQVWLFATPWTTARQASLSITNSRNLLKLMSIELVMPSNYLILWWVIMYGCESWTVKKAERQRIDAFELWCWRRLLKEIQPVHPKGDQSWVFIGRTDVEAETPILWPPDTKNWVIWKDPDAGKDWRWEEKGMSEDEMVWWHHQLNGHVLE